ncbi:MAG TPA: nucleotidyltransferase domain-containing protein [Saprospiraceae bacterium]|nr:nucleotidyltransferase domain-containing protein [Saprospiraceae bacterium]
MVNTEQIDKILNTLKLLIPGIELIYLFGSMADESNNPDSDIDLAFLSSEKISNVQRFDVQEKLASILNKNVDLVDVKTASTVMNFQIVSKGIKLYSKNEKKKADFELSAMGQYYDYKITMQPIFDQILRRGKVYDNN